MRSKLSMLFLFTAALVLARSPLRDTRGAGEVMLLDPMSAGIVCGVLGLGLVLVFASSYRGTLVRFAGSVAFLFAGPAAIAESYIRLAKPMPCMLGSSPWEIRSEALLLWFVGAFLLLLAVRILGRKERRDFVNCAVGAVLVLLASF